MDLVYGHLLKISVVDDSFDFSRLVQSATMLFRVPAIVSPATDAFSPWKQQQSIGFKKNCSADKYSLGSIATNLEYIKGAKHSVHFIRKDDICSHWIHI